MIAFGGYENCVHKDVCKLPICQREAWNAVLWQKVTHTIKQVKRELDEEEREIYFGEDYVDMIVIPGVKFRI